MDSIITAALIAGFISAIGLLVQIYITRKGNQTSLQLAKYSEDIKNKFESSSIFRKFESDCERMRISCWNLQGQLLVLQEAITRNDRINNEEFEEFKVALDNYSEIMNTFLEGWAEVRPDIPRGIQMYVRSRRHDIRNGLRLIQNGSTLITQKYISQKSLAAEIDNIIIMIRNRLQDLDKFSDTLSSIRKEYFIP